MADDSLEILWEQLLSRRAELVRQAFSTLSPAEQGAVLAHLRRMAGTAEAGWHPEQRISAQAALDALEGNTDQNGLASLQPKENGHS